jgi:nucleoside-diphosphate-sugar epimerase
VRVFVAGATGAIGRPLVAQLREAGHEVIGMTRSEERAAALRAQGAEAVIADAFDGGAVRDVITAARPQVVVNQLTDLSHPLNPRKYAEWLAGTNRLRDAGTRNVIDAARSAGATRIISQSIAFAYERTPGTKTEEDPLLGPEAGAMVEGMVSLENQTLAAAGLVLRYGMFYGPGTSFEPGGDQIEQIRRRQLPIIGGGHGFFPFIHVEDAAAATVAAVERGPSGIYNVVDDDPAPGHEWIPYVADLIGAKKPRRVPAFIARLAAGQLAVGATSTPPVSNAKAKRELGWTPRHPSWREGFRSELT